jgi:hypothetical protein
MCRCDEVDFGDEATSNKTDALEQLNAPTGCKGGGVKSHGRVTRYSVLSKFVHLYFVFIYLFFV